MYINAQTNEKVYENTKLWVKAMEEILTSDTELI